MVQRKIYLLFFFAVFLCLLLNEVKELGQSIRIMKPFYFGYSYHPKPKETNVVFVKTHKTGSSTVQNILFRFAERNNLTVALPIPSCGHRFCYPNTFSTRFVHPHMRQPNITASHMRFNRTELQRLMPQNTIYITILREPSSMFESAFDYFYSSCRSFKRVADRKMETFLENPWRYYKPNETDSMLARNTLAFDLGFDKDHSGNDEDFVQALLGDMEKTFSLVMIAEYFEESLVLLRHLLSWDLDDIVYFKLNMRSTSTKQSITPDLASKIRTWNSLDARLYDHFSALLWDKISMMDLSQVATEVQLLKKAQEKLTKSCFQSPMSGLHSASQIKNAKIRPWKPEESVNILGYDLPAKLSKGFSSKTHELCQKLIMPELQHTDALLQAQSLRYQQEQQFQNNNYKNLT